jgi:hypothetical protein
MKNFEIIKRENHIFVQSINYTNPINNLCEIAEELSIYNYEGEVYFDLLLTNGNSSNRFLLSRFINRTFDMKSFKKTSISSRLKQEITFYYKSHREYLSNSILTPSIIDEIVNC